jgi:hypothetical protein
MADRMGQLGIQRPRLDAREAGDLAGFLYSLNYFDAPAMPRPGSGSSRRSGASSATPYAERAV